MIYLFHGKFIALFFELSQLSRNPLTILTRFKYNQVQLMPTFLTKTLTLSYFWSHFTGLKTVGWKKNSKYSSLMILITKLSKQNTYDSRISAMTVHFMKTKLIFVRITNRFYKFVYVSLNSHWIQTICRKRYTSAVILQCAFARAA